VMSFQPSETAKLATILALAAFVSFRGLHMRGPFSFGAAGLIAVVAVRNLVAVDTVLNSLALAACVIGLGSSRAMAWFSRGGDASYGMYVLAWPVQQFVLLLVAPFWLSLLLAFLATTALGYATWHAYERRLMASPKRLAERRRFAA